ncbi:MAG: LysM peptidoglycan-binding domain-containing protein [Spirochaetales bacterium]|nr:LysM peptidoglycan-binding domain-containing protein [Spirochaetales bacterium]
MKSIGIKLADGTFYPILQEGSPDSKNINLTTVQDNQTTVHVDLYRSETNSMEDAQYVDTLEIKNLNPHENGEPTLALEINLDENNQLNAQIKDPETGKKSETQINLISRTLADRNEPVNFNIDIEPPEQDFNKEENAFPQEPDFDNTIANDFVDGFSNDDSEPEVNADSDLDLNDTEENEVIGPSPNDEDFSFDSVDTPADKKTEHENADVKAEIETQEQENSLPEVSVIEQDESDIASAISEEEVQFLQKENLTPENSEPEVAPDFSQEDEFALPDFDDEPSASTDTADTSETAEPEIAPDFSQEDEFTLPDFDDEPATSTDAADTSETNQPSVVGLGGIFDDNFGEPDLTSDNSDLTDDLFETKDPTFVPKNDMFNDLYDKETLEGNSTYTEENEIKHKTKVPVIICIVCAVICILAALLVLFVIPSRINLINKAKTSEPQKVEQKAEPEKETPNTKSAEQEELKTEQPAAEQNPLPEEIQEEPVAELAEPIPAEEDKIVVAEIPEAVVPEQPVVVEKLPDIIYKIKWGDTLWDISNAYYKNPWRYKPLAKYNNIKNPDHIISGHTIKIPQE